MVVERDEKPKKKPLPVAVLVLGDALLIGVALCVFALFHHVLPRAYDATAQPSGRVVSASAESAASVTGVASAAATPPTPTAQDPAGQNPVVFTGAGVDAAAAGGSGESTAALPDSAAGEAAGTPARGIVSEPATSVPSTDLGGGKFADKFTGGEVIATDSTYVSGNANVTLTQVQQNGVTYYLEDIYIRNIENLRTAFAGDTYGRSITEWVLDMAVAHDAIAAINGDYYGIGQSSVVIRNGVLYGSRPGANDVCVLFRDGAMQIVPAAEFDAQALMAAGAYQAWSFGPSLLFGDGSALTSFRSRLSGLNPRTAIGYYEPGHYVFVVVDGRQQGYSNGLTLAGLASLFEKLGCTVAYNLDGGKTSSMTFGDALANLPTQGGRETSDIIYIGE